MNFTVPSMELYAISTSCCSILLSFLFLGYMIYFVCKHELVGFSSLPENKSVFNRFNVLILVGSMGSIGYNITLIFNIFTQDQTGRSNNIAIVNSISFILTEYSYVQYIWARGGDIVRRQFKKVYRVTSVCMKAVPILMIIQFGSSLCMVYLLDFEFPKYFYYAIHGFDGLLVLCFDIALLASFASFLQGTHDDDVDVRYDFKIISQYGIISSTICFCMVADFIATSLVDVHLERMLFSVLGLLSGFIFCTLGIMKIRVFREMQNQKNANPLESFCVKEKLESTGRGASSTGRKQSEVTNSRCVGGQSTVV
ncbi:hypothetical protein BDR26DRAFT_354477 [Obelidium mucronatum]|nr:hypothetical protein BDR26DRAFT_354477 [Obelidium mucronatum]